MKKNRTIILWTISILLTLLILIYQRITGPTYPIKGQEYFQGQKIRYKLLRSHTEFKDLPVEIKVTNMTTEGFLYWKRHKTKDKWTVVTMERKENSLVGKIPGQPKAGKIEYMVRVRSKNQDFILNNGKSAVARFKGSVPLFFLLLHIIFMFLGILFALRTGLEALQKNGNFYWLVNITLAIIFLGGMVLGPIIQKYAFGDFWTGFPYGYDLTDNKILLVLIFWIVAFILKKRNKWWIVVAVALMLIVYLIPHSILGSELDYEKGKMRNKFSVNFHSQDIPRLNC